MRVAYFFWQTIINRLFQSNELEVKLLKYLDPRL